MPWHEVSAMDQRREFVRLATQEGVNRRELCRRFGISPAVGYKWLGRWVGGDRDLADRSRCPHTSPNRCAAATEGFVLSVRDAHPAWGARKIARCLEREGHAVPAMSTIHQILRRHGRVSETTGGACRDYQRFEKAAPNQLWQMDFKGWKRLPDGRCHPLTVVDDHSRYAVCLEACADQQGETVRQRLTTTFRRYGLPTPGAASTTSSARTRRSATMCRRAATVRARGASRSAFRRPTTTRARSSVWCRRPRTTSASRGGPGTCPAPSGASASPSGRCRPTAATVFSSAPSRSPRST